MSALDFEDHGDGRFVLRGRLDFHTAPGALERSRDLFADHASIEVDMTEVQKSDSAGLALLLEWVNWARNYVREIRFVNIPDQITAIAQICEVENLLTAGERWTGV